MGTMTMRATGLAVVFVAGVAVGVAIKPSSAEAQVVVSDPGLLAESVMQTLKQIEQYKTQLENYELAVRDHLAPAAWLWDQSQLIIDQVTRLIEYADVTRLGAKDVDAYLSRFKSVDYYRNSSCFKNHGCPKEELALLNRGRELKAKSQKATNEAMFRELDKQHDQLRSDAEYLRQVQLKARTAEGQLQALGYANQLASAQAAQLVQIRGLLIAQQKVLLAERQTRDDREALMDAAAEHLRSGKYTPSPKREWGGS